MEPPKYLVNSIDSALIILIYFLSIIILNAYKNEEIREEANQAKETEKNQDVSVDVDALNKEHCERILKIMGAGSFDGMYLAIMGKEINAYELNKLAQNTTTFYKNNYSYDVINENYSDYEKEWLSFLSKSHLETISLGFQG